MEKNRTGQREWLDRATAGIRFGPDRAAVRAELAAHLEDKAADIQRIFPGISPEEAEDRALEGMGDAEELGKELAKVHRPWLGYLWRVSRWAVGLALCAALVCWAGRGISALEERRMLEEAGAPEVSWNRLVYQYYLDGQGDVPFPDAPFDFAWEAADVERASLLAARPEASVEAGAFRLTAERLALWAFTAGELTQEEREALGVEPGETVEQLFVELKASGLPWQKLAWEAAGRISARDNLGGQYVSQAQRVGGERRYVSATQWEEGTFSRTYLLAIRGVDPQAEWLLLEYDWGGVSWTLTLPLKEG